MALCTSASKLSLCLASAASRPLPNPDDVAGAVCSQDAWCQVLGGGMQRMPSWDPRSLVPSTPCTLRAAHSRCLLAGGVGGVPS
jgi:hypothetical protein